jgi:hypothetical protein
LQPRIQTPPPTNLIHLIAAENKGIRMGFSGNT